MQKDTENIAFKIKINNEYLGTAGIKEGVLTAIANYIKRKELDPEKLKLEVGGLENNFDGANIITKWIVARPLNVGDKIEIEIVRSILFDRPVKKYREDLDLAEREKRKYYESLKQE